MDSFGLVWLVLWSLVCVVFGESSVSKVLWPIDPKMEESPESHQTHKIIGTNSGRFVHTVKQRHCGDDNVLADDEKPHSLSFDSRIGHTISNHSDGMVTLQGLNVSPFRTPLLLSSARKKIRREPVSLR